MNLIDVRRTKSGDLPLATNTIRKFHHIGRYPSIILKVSNKLFFDMDAWEDLVEETRAKQVAKSNKEIP